MSEYVSFRHGALHVVQQARPKDEIQRELKRIDDRLFLEQQIGFDQKPVWCVVCAVGGDVPPITLLEYRDERSNEPIPYITSQIVDRVARMDRNGKRLTARVIEANQRKIDADRRRADAEYRALQEDHMKAMDPMHSALLPRGQSLRMARDKARSRGEKV